jgi:hypothetical protein
VPYNLNKPEFLDVLFDVDTENTIPSIHYRNKHKEALHMTLVATFYGYYVYETYQNKHVEENKNYTRDNPRN